jgi:uncharacterized protein (TIGR02246 family)
MREQPTSGAGIVYPPEEKEVRALYREVLECWNQRDAAGMGLFADDGYLIGFDGSQMNRRTEIEAALSRIFSDT